MAKKVISTTKPDVPLYCRNTQTKRTTVKSRLIQVSAHIMFVPVFLSAMALFIPVYVITGKSTLDWLDDRYMKLL